MYSYSAYDLRLRSVFELPELPAIDSESADPDINIVRNTVEPVPDTVEGTGGRRIEAAPDAVRLTYDSVGSFLVENGTRILCDPLDEEASQQEFFRRLIENELLGLILYQRDHLVLHASAVSVNGKAAIFLGPRGAGKSTTAAAFGVEGHSVLEDDVVAIRFDSGVPTVVPGVPQLRLKSDAAAALGVTDASIPAEEPWYEKRMLQMDDIPDPAPLAGCYILAEGESCVLEPVTGPDQILDLITQTHARGLLSDTDQSSIHFEQCTRVINAVPFQLLKRPQDHEQLPSLVALVAKDIGD